MRIAGIVLAGGASRRMGIDKAGLRLGNGTVLDLIVGEISKITSRIYIASGSAIRKEGIVTQYDQVMDIYPGSGPLAGLHAVLLRSDADLHLVVPCDMPFIRAELLLAMIPMIEIEQGTTYQAVVPCIKGQIHPLMAVYHRSIRSTLETVLAADERRVMDMLDQISVRYVTENELEASSHIPAASVAAMFTNMNAREDYVRVKQIYACHRRER